MKFILGISQAHRETFLDRLMDLSPNENGNQLNSIKNTIQATINQITRESDIIWFHQLIYIQLRK